MPHLFLSTIFKKSACIVNLNCKVGQDPCVTYSCTCTELEHCSYTQRGQCVCDDGRLRQSEHASLIFLDSSGDLANETKLKGAGA